MNENKVFVVEGWMSPRVREAKIVGKGPHISGKQYLIVDGGDDHGLLFGESIFDTIYSAERERVRRLR